MREDIMTSKMRVLIEYGVPSNSVHIPVAGGVYFQEMGGVSINTYWNSSEFNNRDELFMISNTYFSLQNFVTMLQHYNGWREKFDVAFMFQLKPNAQSLLSLDKLLSSNCYIDAFAVLRSMLSRLNLLLLCSLKPALFDCWLKNPKQEIFLDGHIRKELENNGIFTMNHLYELSSEIIHGHLRGLENVGYMQQGIFPHIPAIENQILVISKFIFGMSCFSMISMMKIDRNLKLDDDGLVTHNNLMKFFLSTCLVHNRYDHLWTVIAKGRHWRKSGKNKMIIGGSFDHQKYFDLLLKFHRASGQKKKLSSKYQN